MRRARSHPESPIGATLDRLAAAERAFLRAEFLAPAVAGGAVAVRIAGVVCRLRIEPADFAGWGVFRASSSALAQLLRPANLAERRQYLALFPAVSLVLVRAKGPTAWLAAAAQRGDARVRVDGAVPVRLVEDAERFDTVRARFDGAQFWFDEVDGRADAGAAAYLREMLEAMTDPAALARPGLTAEQRAAYAMEHGRRRAAEAARALLDFDRRAATERRTGEGRVRAALAHAGAQFGDVADRGDVYRVTYAVDGARHTSLVDKRDLTVHTAGICLSGGDRAFDLHSLVGVIREGRGA